MQTQSFAIMTPNEIEKRSFEIITEELGSTILPEEQAPIIKRVIHTTADFDYAKNLYFSDNVVSIALEAVTNGLTIFTDTNMAKAGINNGALRKLGCTVECFMSDPDIAETAKLKGTTRAVASMEKAAKLPGDKMFVIGNAPTALICLNELIHKGLSPKLVVAVPVGFVNVVESKELIISSGVPCIVARGRKGGSNVAAAICNALLYLAAGRVL